MASNTLSRCSVPSLVACWCCDRYGGLCHAYLVSLLSAFLEDGENGTGCTGPCGSVSCTLQSTAGLYSVSPGVNWMLADIWLRCVKGLQVPFSMGPDNEGIVNIPQPETAGLEWGLVHGLLLQVFHEEVGDDGG